MTLTDDAKAVIALTTRLGSRQRPSLTAKMWHHLALALQDSGHRPSDVFSRSVDLHDLAGVDGDLATRVATLVRDGASATLEVDELRQRGIWTVTIADQDYPRALLDRLEHNAPPVVFGVGIRDLLRTPGVGVVGSREIDEAGAKVATAVALEAVSMGRPVVSGGARGVDQLAMNAAFGANGSVVGVLADSLIGRIRKPDVLQALDSGNTCLITQQAPSSGFSPAGAMNRNKLIYALADVTVVVAATEDTGGTWAGAVEAIKAKNGVVAIWRGAGEGPGNAALERFGGQAIREALDLHELLEQSPDPTEQLSLDLAP